MPPVSRRETELDGASAPFEVLVVCTGNLCRSPLAALLLEARLPGAAGLPGRGLRVASAGTLARPGAPMDPAAAVEAARLGLDPSAHRARRLSAQAVERADLVVGVAREHRAAAVRLAPAAVRRAFTLLELADLLRGLPVEGAVASASEDPATRLRSLVEAAAMRRSLAPLDDPHRIDVPDPYRRGAAAYGRSAREIASAIDGVEGAIRRLVADPLALRGHGA